MTGEGERRGGAFYGRRKGKALRPGQQEAVDTLLPALRPDLSAPPRADLAALFPVPVDRVRLEIGFGGGEHLLHEARAFPATGYIGVEPFENGMAKAVAAIGREDIRNVRLFDQDATLLLDWLPDAALDRVDLLFPDPWPKKRHWKRRFVGAANLDRIARCLRPGAAFRFASDVDSYVEWTLEQVAAHGRLALDDEGRADMRQPWAGWPGTRYEAKAAKAGRGASYLTFRLPR